MVGVIGSSPTTSTKKSLAFLARFFCGLEDEKGKR